MNSTQSVSVDPALIRLYHLNETAPPTELAPFHCEQLVQQCAANMIDLLVKELHLRPISAATTVQITPSECLVLSPSQNFRYTLTPEQIATITEPYFQQMNALYLRCQDNRCPQSTPLKSRSINTSQQVATAPSSSPPNHPSLGTIFREHGHGLRRTSQGPIRRTNPFQFTTPIQERSRRIDSVGCLYDSYNRSTTPSPETSKVQSLNLDSIEEEAKGYCWEEDSIAILNRIDQLLSVMHDESSSNALIEWSHQTLNSPTDCPSEETINTRVETLLNNYEKTIIDYFAVLIRSLIQLKRAQNPQAAIALQLQHKAQKNTNLIHGYTHNQSDADLLKKTLDIVSAAIDRLFQYRLLSLLCPFPHIHFSHDQSTNTLSPVQPFRQQSDLATAERDLNDLHALLTRMKRNHENSSPEVSEDTDRDNGSPPNLARTLDFSETP